MSLKKCIFITVFLLLVSSAFSATEEERFKDWIIGRNYNYFNYGLDKSSGFPYDHISVQKDNSFEYGKYTSPSIIGFWMVLLTDIIKGDLVLNNFSREDAGRALFKTIESIKKAPRWKGLLYWYELKDGIEAAEDRVISSYDNGNFALALMVVSGAFSDSESSWQRRIKKEVDSILLSQSAGWGELYDREAGLLYGVYRYGPLPYLWIDRFYTEARIAALVSLILTDLPQDLWNNLLRKGNCPRGSYTLSNNREVEFFKPWQGAFQAWLPLLFIPEMELSSGLKEAHSNYAAIQIDYALNSKVPLLRSAAADPCSEDGEYHYEPALGVFGASEDWVRSDIAAPYAAALLYPVDKKASLDLFKKTLEKFPQILGSLGFYDSISEEGKVAKVYLAFDQLQLLLSLLSEVNQSYFLSYLEDISKSDLLKQLYSNINF
ncbi:MAG: hypothetical protein P9L98_02040 [Candidatus Kaelpia imicola]|nr:hypothetical protein [Candidatus Kaelpia imicola]